MNWTNALLWVLIGLLMDDAALAVAILLVVGAAVASSMLDVPTGTIAIVLPVVLLLVLAASVDRACRLHRNQAPAWRDDDVE